VFAKATESGKLFQAEIILFVKENLRVAYQTVLLNADWYRPNAKSMIS